MTNGFFGAALGISICLTTLTSSLHIYANITGKRITLIFFADFIFFKVGIVGVFQEKVGKCRKLSKK